MSNELLFQNFPFLTLWACWTDLDWISSWEVEVGVDHDSLSPRLVHIPHLRSLHLVSSVQRKKDTVDSRYLDPSYLDPITYVELISKSRLFSLCIYCISASRMSNYFYVDTSAISSIIFSPWTYFSQFLLPRISNSDHDEGKKCKQRRRRSLS